MGALVEGRQANKAVGEMIGSGDGFYDIFVLILASIDMKIKLSGGTRRVVYWILQENTTPNHPNQSHYTLSPSKPC